jgi:hypothetical protein
MPKEIKYPLIFASAFSQEQGAALNEASASGLVQMSRILRSAVDLWRAHHAWLRSQGYSALTATEYLLKQTEVKQGQAQPPPSFAPPPSPSPFQAAPINEKVAVNGR